MNEELITACREGRLDDVQTLLSKNGIDVNSKDKHGRTSLMRASYGGHAHIVRMLLEKNAEVDTADKFGFTALMHACYKGQLLAVDALLSKNADMDIQCDNGKTALMYAEQEGYQTIVKELLKNQVIKLKKENGILRGRQLIQHAMLDSFQRTKQEEYRENPRSTKQECPEIPMEYVHYCTNNFAPDRHLGKGGFGTVFEALDGEDKNIKFVVKRIDRKKDEDAKSARRELEVTRDSS